MRSSMIYLEMKYLKTKNGSYIFLAKARLRACWCWDVSTPSFGSHLKQPYSDQKGRLCPPYTDVHTKFWKPQERLEVWLKLQQFVLFAWVTPNISLYVTVGRKAFLFFCFLCAGKTFFYASKSCFYWCNFFCAWDLQNRKWSAKIFQSQGYSKVVLDDTNYIVTFYFI